MADIEKIVARLKQGKPVGAIVLLGEDIYLREMSRKRIVDAAIPEAMREWAIARVSARDTGWDEILGRAQMLPMLAPQQLLIVDDSEFVEKLGEKNRDEILGALGQYLESPAPFTTLLIEVNALDRRQKFFKLLDEKAEIVTLELSGESAATLAVQMAKDLGADIDREAATLVAQSLNDEPARIRMEIDKLATYASGRKITTDDVRALVVAARRNTVWQLTEMLASGNRNAALAFLNNLLREGEQPAGIIGALAWTYRKLIEARGMPPHMNGFQAARQLGMRPEAAELALRQAHRYKREKLIESLATLAEADSRVKSSNPDPHAFMEFLIARL